MIELLFSYGILPDKMVWFDAESFEDPDEYADVFEALIALTDSALPLETVTWELGNKINRKTSEEIFYTTVSFSHAQERYRIELVCEGWFDEAMVLSLNEILEKHKSVTSRFVFIKTADQSLVIVFVDPETAQKLENDGLIDHEYKLPKS